MDENDIAKIIVDIAYNMHLTLGPGLLESVYETIMKKKLEKAGLFVDSQKPVSIIYEDIIIPDAFRADMIVNDLVIIELKSVEKTLNVHYKQLLTYLRLSNKKLGLLINFGENLIKDGIKRIVNHLDDTSS